MARKSVQVDSGPVEATDQLRHVPKGKWHDLMLARQQFLEVRLSHDCRCLVEFVDDAKQMFKPLGFASVEDMIRDGYGLEPEEVAIAVRWLELNPPDEPVPMDAAVKLGKHGNNQHTPGHSRANVPYGDNEAYWAAVLERDRPDVRLKEGKAIETATKLGFRKPRKRLTKFEQIMRWLPALTATEKRKLKEMLG